MVAVFSSGTFGAANTGRALAWLWHALHISITGRHFVFIHALIRKSAHLTAYGLLSALFFRAWRGEARDKRWKWTWAILALLISLATALSDELHQYFTPGRTGAVSDVELDMMGAGFAQLLIVAFTAGRKKRPGQR